MSPNRRDTSLYDVTVSSITKPVADNIVSYVKKTRGSPRGVDITPLCPQIVTDAESAPMSHSSGNEISPRDKASRRSRLFSPIRSMSDDAAIIRNWWIETISDWEQTRLGLFYLDNPVDMKTVYAKYEAYCTEKKHRPLYHVPFWVYMTELTLFNIVVDVVLFPGLRECHDFMNEKS